MSIVTVDGKPASREGRLHPARKGVIGASEAAVVLGLTGSRLRMYLRKTGELPDDEGSEAMAWGIRLEDDIADAYQERTGRVIEHTQRFGVHPEHHFMGATLDAITTCRRVVEFKSVGPWGYGRQLGDDGESETLPDAFVVQANVQLAIAGALGWADPDEADIAVFGPALQLRVYPVRRNDALIAMAADAIERFMADHVIPGIPPEEFAPEDAEAVARVFRRETGEILPGDQALVDAAARYHRIGESIRDMKAERARAEAEIRMWLGNAAGADAAGWEVRRKLITVNHKAKESFTSEYIRITVKETRS